MYNFRLATDLFQKQWPRMGSKEEWEYLYSEIINQSTLDDSEYSALERVKATYYQLSIGSSCKFLRNTNTHALSRISLLGKQKLAVEKLYISQTSLFWSSYHRNLSGNRVIACPQNQRRKLISFTLLQNLAQNLVHTTFRLWDVKRARMQLNCIQIYPIILLNMAK